MLEQATNAENELIFVAMFIVCKDCFKDIKDSTREMEDKAFQGRTRTLKERCWLTSQQSSKADTGRGIMMAKVRQTSEVNT